MNREALVCVIRSVSRRAVLGGALSALVLALGPAAALATSIPGPNGKIAFASGRAASNNPSPADGNDEQSRIWVADYPNGTPVQVTTLPAEQQRHPNWSPDHTRIVYAAGKAFSGEYALWIVDLRTGEQTEFVPKAPMQDRPSWSPNGKEIAYGSNGDLFMKETEPPFEVVQLTNTPGVVEERPVWSPDGNTLYYNRKETGKTRDIYSKSPVTPAGAEIPIVTGETEDWQPAVSPDGKRLCFLRGEQNEKSDIWTVNVNGTGAAPFANTANGELNCVWSPDGTKIMYTQGAFSAGELATRDINGGSFELMTSMNLVAKHFDGNADWATNFPPKCDAKSAEIPVNGFTTIAFSCVDPDAGLGAAPPTPTPLENEAFEVASQPAHGNLGGLSNGRVIYTPDKDFKGTDTFTYTGTDGNSNAPPATVTIHVGTTKGGGGDTTPPTISDVKVSTKRWRRGSKLASFSRLAHASLVPVGTTISFQLSEVAHATLTFQRQKSARHKTRRFTTAGSISLGAKQGKNSVRFQGQLTKSRRLPPGRYRVVVGAQDAAGNQAQPQSSTNFTIAPG